jgi:hypothetical protein
MANLLGENIGTNYRGILNLNTLNGNLSATLQAVTDGSGNTGPLQLSTVSVSFGGSTGLNWDNANIRLGIGTNTPLGILHLKTVAATTRLLLDGDAAQSKIITYRTAGLQRFGLYTNNTAESGANAGSDFAIRAYSDAGTLLSTPIFIKRSTGFVGIGTTTPSARLDVRGDGTNPIARFENGAGVQTVGVLDNGVVALSNTSITGYTLFSTFNIVNNGGTSMTMDRFGGSPHFNYRSAGGTLAAPTVTPTGIIGYMGFWSHDATNFQRNIIIAASNDSMSAGLSTVQRLVFGMGPTAGSNEYYYAMVNGNSYFGTSAFSFVPTARLQVRGDGTNPIQIWENGTTLATVATVSNSGMSITSGSLPSATQALSVSGTLSSTVATQIGSTFYFTGSGSGANSVRGIDANLLAGYTGTQTSFTINARNASAGVGVSLWNPNGFGNYGIFGESQGTTVGHNAGGIFLGSRSSVLNVGVVGKAVLATNSPNMNIGAIGLSLNATINVGGYFGLHSVTGSGNTPPTILTSSALIASNGTTGADIFRACNNNSVVFIIDGLGNTIVGSSTGPVISAKFQIDSTTQGFLPPRMTTAEINLIATPADGLIVYNTTIGHLCVRQAGAWVRINHSPM